MYNMKVLYLFRKAINVESYLLGFKRINLFIECYINIEKITKANPIKAPPMSRQGYSHIVFQKYAS